MLRGQKHLPQGLMLNSQGHRVEQKTIPSSNPLIFICVQWACLYMQVNEYIKLR